MAPHFVSTMLGPKYAKLPQESKWQQESSVEVDESANAVRRQSFWTVRNIAQLAIALACGSLLGFFAPSITSGITRMPNSGQDHSKHLEHHHPPHGGDLVAEDDGVGCGSTAEEALALGCHYDMMASTWLPDQCHDRELLDQMLTEVSWDWYVDQQHTQEVPQSLTYSGNFTKLYPLYDFHIHHCVYLWRKLHKALIYRTGIDEDLYDYQHTEHCTKMIMSWHEPRKTVTRSVPGFPTCRKFSYYQPVNGVPPNITTDTH